MKTLKLALLSTGAVAAVAAGGFAYATVGNSSSATSAKLPDAASAVRHGPAVPHSVPTCLPNAAKHLPKVPGKLKNATNGKLPKVPGANQLPKVPSANQLPKVPGANQLPQVPGAGQLPQAPGAGQLPKAPGQLPKVPGQLPKVPGADQLPQAGNLPTCAPQLPGNPAANLPAAPKPGVPSVSNVASCSAVPPAIHMQNGRAKDFTLPNGMHLAVSHTHSVMLNGRKVCGRIEKFVGTAGQWFSVERLNTPPQTTVGDVAKALKLPSTGNIASVSGLNTWQSPLNTGSMWVSDKGYAVNVSGSPAMVGALPAIVSQLRQMG